MKNLTIVVVLVGSTIGAGLYVGLATIAPVCDKIATLIGR